MAVYKELAATQDKPVFQVQTWTYDCLYSESSDTGLWSQTDHGEAPQKGKWRL